MRRSQEPSDKDELAEFVRAWRRPNSIARESERERERERERGRERDVAHVATCGTLSTVSKVRHGDSVMLQVLPRTVTTP